MPESFASYWVNTNLCMNDATLEISKRDKILNVKIPHGNIT